MKKITGFIAFFFAIIILLMALIPLFLKGKVTRIVQNKANEYLMAEVSFNKLSFNLFTDFPDVSVSIPKLIVAGIDSFANDTLVKAEKVKITVNLRSILSDAGVSVKKIILEEPIIYAKVLSNGKANWDIVRPDSSVKYVEDTTTVRLHLREIKIKDAFLIYDDNKSDIFVSLKGWNGTLKGDLASDRSLLSTNSTVSALSFAYNKIPFLQNLKLDANMSLDADFENNTYTFKTNSIKLNAIDMSFDGFVQFPDTSTTRFDLKLNTENITFKKFLSLIPALYTKDFETLKTSGDLKINAYIKGDMIADNYPPFDLKIEIENGFFQYPTLPESVKDIFVNAHLYSLGGSLDNARVDISKFHFNMAGNPFDLLLSISTPVSDPEFKGKMKGVVDLGKLTKVYPLEKETKLGGIFKADVNASGRMSSIDQKQYDKLSVNGSLSAKNIVYKSYGKSDIKITNAEMKLSSKELSMNSLDMMIDKNDFHANGKLSNYLSWFLRDDMLKGNIYLESSYLNLNDFMKKESSVVKDTVPMLAFNIPQNLDLNLIANAKTVQFNKMILKNLQARMRVGEGRVTFNNLSANALGGLIMVDGYYDSKVKDKPEVSFGLNFQNVTFNETFKTFNVVKSLVPVFEKTKGDFSLKMKFKSDLNKYMDPNLGSITGEGLLQSQNIQISGIKALDLLATTIKKESLKNIAPKDLKIPFSISDGKIKTSPFSINISDVKLIFEGSTGLDKTIDYKVNAKLPESMTGNFISNIKGTIKGTFLKPIISLDTEDIAMQALKGLSDQILEKATGKNTEETISKAKEEIEKKAIEIRAKAKAAGDMIVKQAENEGNKLIEKANNPLLKAAAKQTAEVFKNEAKKKAAELEAKAEKEITDLYESIKK